MTKTEFLLNQKQYEKEPVMFFLNVNRYDREDIQKYNRKKLAEECSCAIPLSEFDEEWNDTDGASEYLPNPYETWCKVSMPE